MKLTSLAVIAFFLLSTEANAQYEDFKETLAGAEAGEPWAQVLLGVMYSEGDGVAEDDQEAMKWTHLAAEQGLAEAQFNLGVMYADGEGVTENNQEAVKWYRLAAEQGLDVAQYNLGVMYANGDGVAQDNLQAYIWYAVAAAQGDEDAAAARDFSAGNLTPQALEQAQALATKCFESNFKDCGE